STMHIKHFVMLATFCFFILIVQLPSTIILFPYTTLFRSAPTRVHTSDFGIGSCHRVAVHHSGTAPEIACRAVGIGVEAACIGADCRLNLAPPASAAHRLVHRRSGVTLSLARTSL